MSASKKIIFDATIGEGSTQWFGTITLKNIRYAEDDAPVTVQEFLGVRFQGPRVTADVAVQAILEPFQVTKLEAATKPLEEGEGEGVVVTAKVLTEGPRTFGKNDTLVWNVNGDLTGKGEEYLKSIEVWADEVGEEKEEKE
ncbi:hypothetical protein F5X68DRAFT_194159 [Plectosphaerella plurivora]|uniref:Uncharacterized protein n=1 Tax=Plectosphaerella plurivora TaxID=936078 RepID=A0A9P9A7T8_9PEZI|nr:hypothetical protein F5X68DRAFT_194159 [Plectosphaerella plurivora]